MNEKELDRSLKIRTTGIREWPTHSLHYNRYEATPYEALHTLFTAYSIASTDELIDFGCGKGRVSFYIHHLTNCKVIGVEMNEPLYKEALQNMHSYLNVHRSKKHRLQFTCQLAERFTIPASANRFYFFNPFSIPIFSKVLRNIRQSLEETPRVIDLILFYPTEDYLQFLEKQADFHPILEVPSTSEYPNDRFIIFRTQY